VQSVADGRAEEWKMAEPGGEEQPDDLRGYGYSGKPATGYDKRTMAADIRALADRLGHDRIAVVGHDRGARVTLRLAKDHPDLVRRLAVLDNVPHPDGLPADGRPAGRRAVVVPVQPGARSTEGTDRRAGGEETVLTAST
jgi:pimeloyl-ACP methyl ester carboxylesterase